MNKKIFILTAGMLIFSTLACNLPFLGRVQDESATQSPEVLPAGFRKFSHNGIEITLPETYAIGDIDENLEKLTENIPALTEVIGFDIQRLLGNFTEDVILWAYDTEGLEANQTNLLVIKNDALSVMPLGILASSSDLILGDEVDILSQDRLVLGDRDTLRFLTKIDIGDNQISQAVYLFKDSGKLWIVGFLTRETQIEDHLSDFDTAVASISIISVE